MLQLDPFVMYGERVRIVDKTPNTNPLGVVDYEHYNPSANELNFYLNTQSLNCRVILVVDVIKYSCVSFDIL